MSALGWINTGHRLLLAPLFRRRPAGKPVRRAATPGLESLETIDLMSVAGLHRVAQTAAVANPAQVVPFVAHAITVNSGALSTPTQTTAFQTATVPTTLTNFTQPFTPPIGLFDPNLGTLIRVRVTTSATLTSTIQSANTSTNSPADITGFTRGDFQITGVGSQAIAGGLDATTGNPVNVAVSPGGPNSYTVVVTPVPPGTSVPTNGVTFSALNATTTRAIDLTSPADLAFFTAGAGRTAITPNLSASAQSGASAPNGNLQTSVVTSGSGVVTVSYEYMPQCPPVTQLVRFGIHHQPTQLQLSFGGPLNPADASNPAFYQVVAPNRSGSFTGPGTRIIPVTSAVYNPSNSTVTLTTAQQLNVHHLFQLQVKVPCNNGNTSVVEFGSKASLGGYYFHGRHFLRGANGRFVLG